MHRTASHPDSAPTPLWRADSRVARGHLVGAYSAQGGVPGLCCTSAAQAIAEQHATGDNEPWMPCRYYSAPAPCLLDPLDIGLVIDGVENRRSGLMYPLPPPVFELCDPIVDRLSCVNDLLVKLCLSMIHLQAPAFFEG